MTVAPRISRAELQAALTERNVRAFLAVIRRGEGTSDVDGYRRHFGGELFADFADHPRRKITRGSLTSTAAGAYQFLARTWDGLVAQYGFTAFTPAQQDEAAVALIAGRGALPAVRAGKLDEAVALCCREWASLPGSPYGQPTISMPDARATYLAAGGTLNGAGGRVGEPTGPVETDGTGAQTEPYRAPEPAPSHSVDAVDQVVGRNPPAVGPAEAQPITQHEGAPVLPPILLPLAGALIEAFRPLAAEKVQTLLAKHGATADTAERITSAAIDAAQAVAGIADPIAAVAAVRADPAKMERVESAVLARVDELLPLVERLAAIDERARAADEASADAAAARSRADEWDMTRAVVYGGCGLIALLVALVGAVVLLQLLRPGVGAITSEVWAQVAGLIGFASGVGTSIVAYRFGGRRTPAAQDVIAAASRLRREVSE